jgi:hypothetical protein
MRKRPQSLSRHIEDHSEKAPALLFRFLHRFARSELILSVFPVIDHSIEHSIDPPKVLQDVGIHEHDCCL